MEEALPKKHPVSPLKDKYQDIEKGLNLDQ
jgi:hypothetical protein